MKDLDIFDRFIERHRLNVKIKQDLQRSAPQQCVPLPNSVFLKRFHGKDETLDAVTPAPKYHIPKPVKARASLVTKRTTVSRKNLPNSLNLTAAVEAISDGQGGKVNGVSILKRNDEPRHRRLLYM